MEGVGHLVGLEHGQLQPLVGRGGRQRAVLAGWQSFIDELEQIAADLQGGPA